MPTPKAGISLAKFGPKVGYSERQLRNLVRRGMPTLKTKPLRVDEDSARAWILAHAAGGTPGPGRPAKDADSAKPAKPAVDNSAAHTPLFIESPLQSLVLSGGGSPEDILRLASMPPDKGGISRAVAENLRTIAAATDAVMTLRKNSGKLLDAAAVEDTWKRFIAGLARDLERMAGRAADRVLAAMNRPPSDKAKIERAIAKEVDSLRARLIAPSSGDDDVEDPQG